jgi:hypothetical protein
MSHHGRAKRKQEDAQESREASEVSKSAQLSEEELEEVAGGVTNNGSGTISVIKK